MTVCERLKSGKVRRMIDVIDFLIEINERGAGVVSDSRTFLFFFVVGLFQILDLESRFVLWINLKDLVGIVFSACNILVDV